MCFFNKKKKEKKDIKNVEQNENKEVKVEQSKEEQKKEEISSQDKTKKAVYRVLYDKEDKLWKIKKDGAKRVIDSKKTKEEALVRVQELSDSQDTKFVVYKKDGKFQKKANLNLKNDNK